MASKLFGTDGIRGTANLEPMTAETALRVGMAAAFGDDLFGSYLWRTLSEQEGVDLSQSRPGPGWSTPAGGRTGWSRPVATGKAGSRRT